MKTVHNFSGKVEWLLSRPNKYNKYTMNFFPKDPGVRKAVKETGIKNSPKVSEKGDLEGQMFYIFRSDQPFVVTTPDGEPVTSMIGNGSEITVRLEVERFVSPTHGPTARSKVIGVVVDNLIPYVKAVVTEEKDEPPALPA